MKFTACILLGALLICPQGHAPEKQTEKQTPKQTPRGTTPMQHIFSVYDNKAEAYLQPFFATAPGLAVRMFQQAVNDPEHDMSKYAADYNLFQIGSWHPQTGELVQLEHMINLGSGLEHQTQQEPPAGSPLNR